MDKKPDINIKLLKSWVDGNCTPAEARAVEQWLSESPGHVEMLEELARPDMDSLTDFDRKKVKAEVFNKIGSSGLSSDDTRQRQKSPLPTVTALISPWKQSHAAWWLRIAAVVLVIVTAGILTWYHQGTKTTEQVVYKEITSPARTITSFTLSDGTTVELNANSHLRYPTSFSNDKREVHLEGEAYFSVTSDSDRPFKVYSGHLTTTVLGTEFNVNYMPDLGRVDVALVEGLVSVEASGPNTSHSQVMLEPNQWVSYSDSYRSLRIREGVRNKILWRDEILEFEGKTLLEVASILENWYGVNVGIEDSLSAAMKVTGTFEDESLEHVLETLKFVVGIEYEMNKNEDNEIDNVMLRRKEL